MDRKPDLLEVVGALHATGCFACLLNGRQQESYQNADDGDDDEEFDKRKPSLFPKESLHEAFPSLTFICHV